jgi:cellobiose-specific phosphotransferase system component IIA
LVLTAIAARKYLLEAVELARNNGDTMELAKRLNHLSSAMLACGDRYSALSTICESLALLAKIKLDPKMPAWSIKVRAMLVHAMVTRSIDEANKALEEAHRMTAKDNLLICDIEAFIKEVGNIGWKKVMGSAAVAVFSVAGVLALVM